MEWYRMNSWIVFQSCSVSDGGHPSVHCVLRQTDSIQVWNQPRESFWRLPSEHDLWTSLPMPWGLFHYSGSLVKEEGLLKFAHIVFFFILVLTTNVRSCKHEFQTCWCDLRSRQKSCHLFPHRITSPVPSPPSSRGSSLLAFEIFNDFSTHTHTENEKNCPVEDPGHQYLFCLSGSPLAISNFLWRSTLRKTTILNQSCFHCGGEKRD